MNRCSVCPCTYSSVFTPSLSIMFFLCWICCIAIAKNTPQRLPPKPVDHDGPPPPSIQNSSISVAAFWQLDSLILVWICNFFFLLAMHVQEEFKNSGRKKQQKILKLVVMLHVHFYFSVAVAVASPPAEGCIFRWSDVTWLWTCLKLLKKIISGPPDYVSFHQCSVVLFTTSANISMQNYLWLKCREEECGRRHTTTTTLSFTQCQRKYRRSLLLLRQCSRFPFHPTLKMLRGVACFNLQKLLPMDKKM